MNIGNFCDIIKDPTEGDLFYAVVQGKYDQKDEWSIISSGSTEVEAMQNFIIEVYKKYLNCKGKICEIGKSISEVGVFLTCEDLILTPKDIEKEANFDDHILTSFDAMNYDKEENAWTRLYR